MENKNLLLAILLSVGFLFFWSMFVIPRYAPPPAQSVPAATSAGAAAPSSPAPAIIPAHTGPTAGQVQPEAILRDEHNEIIFTPQGGAVRHWRLKLKGQEVDLVEKPDAELHPLATIPESGYAIRQIAHGKRQRKGVQMEAVLPNQIRLIKTLTLGDDGFMHDLSFRFKNPTSQTIQFKDFHVGWGPWLGTVPSEKKENMMTTRALVKTADDAKRLEPGAYPAIGQWAAMDNRYFLVAFMPVSGVTPRLQVSGKTTRSFLFFTNHEIEEIKLTQDVTVPAGGQADIHYQMYVGPKGFTHLKNYGKELEAAVDFGWFSSLGKLALRVLYAFKRMTGNYGWGIVIMTVLLQILLLPLTIKSFRAMMAMKELQPQIAALQKTYKGDPKRLQIEMMNLYKKSGANPLGGCLPMLLQMPIFIALFNALRNAYELHRAPWIGWIRDLSAPDPYYILPIVMGVGMFFQQRLSGAVTDPTQRQMMYIMPVIFTVMFLNFSSGLVLYWLVQSMVTMGIQWGLLRFHHRPQKPKFELVG